MGHFWLSATQGRIGGLQLQFEPTAEPEPVHQKRLHLDMAGGLDRWADAACLLTRGATWDRHRAGARTTGRAGHPEGSEFCVLRPGHPGVLADSGLVANRLDTAEENRCDSRPSGGPRPSGTRSSPLNEVSDCAEATPTRSRWRWGCLRRRSHATTALQWKVGSSRHGEAVVVSHSGEGVP
ncbi:VOC family protein [Streptomyces cinereoruber]